MIIPPKPILTGNKQLGSYFLGFAKEELRKLKARMAAVRPRPLPEGFHVVRPFPNVVVEVWASIHYSEVRIHVDAPSGKKGEFGAVASDMYCLCLPHFALGRILEVFPVEPEQGINPLTGDEFAETDSAWQERLETYLDTLDSRRFSYTMEICSKSSYLYCEGIYDANFGRYYPGQVVLVTLAAQESALDCGRGCLMDGERFSTLMVSPLSVAMMSKWRETWTTE